MQIKAANLGYIQYLVEPIKDERRQLLFHARPNLKGLMERERCFFLLFNEFDDDESLSVEEVLLSSQSSFALIGGRVFLKENKCATKVHVLNEKPVLLRPPPFSLPETPSPSPMLPCPASSDDKPSSMIHHRHQILKHRHHHQRCHLHFLASVEGVE